MSNQLNSFSNPLIEHSIQSIDQMNLSTIQKHHLKLLVHCLAIFKEIATEDMSSIEEDKLLKEWCEKQSQKFNDKNFDQILYDQMSSTAKRLNSLSKSMKKKFKDLVLKDLITLV